MDDTVQASVYSWQVSAWKPLVSLHLDVVVDVDARYSLDCLILRSSGAVVGDEVYFLLSPDAGNKILKYNLGRHCLSTIDLPADVDCWAVALMPAEDGLLGLASSAWDSSLYLWSRSRMLNAEGVAGWVQLRVIEMRAVLPVIITDCKVRVIGYAEGVQRRLRGHMCWHLHYQSRVRVGEEGEPNSLRSRPTLHELLHSRYGSSPLLPLFF